MKLTKEFVKRYLEEDWSQVREGFLSLPIEARMALQEKIEKLEEFAIPELALLNLNTSTQAVEKAYDQFKKMFRDLEKIRRIDMSEWDTFVMIINQYLVTGSDFSKDYKSLDNKLKKKFWARLRYWFDKLISEREQKTGKGEYFDN